ncbi:Asp23/Gls24 family envelope stress response protein [Nocardiopsis nanhaiensis]
MSRYPHRAARRTARGNRQGLALVGLLLIAIGAVAPVLLFDPFGVLGPPGTLGPLAAEDTVWGDLAPLLAAPWVPYAAAGLTVAVTLVAFRWLLVQGRSARVPALFLDEGDRGRTDILARAACKALNREVSAYPGVRRSRAHMTESAREPCLHLELVLAEDADPVAVWQRCRNEALVRLRTSLDLDRLPTVLRVSVSGHPSGRQLA